MIELKQRPKEPSRKRLEYVEVELFPPDKEIRFEDDPDDIDYEEVPNPSLAEIVQHFERKGINIADVKSSYDDISGGEFTYYCGPKFEYTVMEPQEEFDARVEQYNRDCVEYKEWYQNNKEEIKATKAALKSQRDEAKAEQKRIAKLERLRRQQEKIREKLEELV